MPIACTTVLGPVTASPPAKTPGRLVASVAGSASKQLHLLVLTFSFSRPARSGSCEIAEITTSQGSTKFEPSTGTGRRRPLLSGSPSSIFWTSRPVTFPFAPTTRTGATRVWIFTPSTSASSISQALAGISAWVRR